MHGGFSMPLLSVSKAAKLFNVSRPTLQKALKDGTLTGQKVMSGGSESWQIDAAELSRLYSLRDGQADNLPRQDDDDGQPVAMDTSALSKGLSEEVIKELESQLATLRAELAASEAVSEERRRILDDMMKLLPKPDQQQRRTLWQRLFGGR